MPQHTFLTLQEIQQRELAILVAFDRFCAAHGLCYTLLYGTLIGAVRHHGFIPWDDDVDLGIPRPDYEWLVENRQLLLEETGYELLPHKGFPFASAPIGKLVDKSVCVEERGGSGDNYLWIDLFPIDSLPDGQSEAKSLCARIQRIRLILVALTTPVNSALTFKRKMIKLLLRPIGLVVKPESLSRTIVKLAKSTPFGTSQYVNALTWTNYGYEGRFKATGLKDMVRLDFEDHSFPAMGNWHENLSGIYGDYMTVPDECDRITHSLKAWYASETK